MCLSQRLRLEVLRNSLRPLSIYPFLFFPSLFPCLLPSFPSFGFPALSSSTQVGILTFTVFFMKFACSFSSSRGVQQGVWGCVLVAED